MSNLSLKEQLQALGVSSTKNTDQPPLKQTKKKQPAAVSPTKPKPAWLEQAQYGVELLKAYFPACFKEIKEVRPLKVGIKQDLVKNLASREDIVTADKACMVNSLSYYVNSVSYHKSVIEGASRIDLDGNTVGTITAEEARYSAECRKTKFQKKNKVSAQKTKEPEST